MALRAKKAIQADHAESDVVVVDFAMGVVAAGRTARTGKVIPGATAQQPVVVLTGRGPPYLASSVLIVSPNWKGMLVPARQAYSHWASVGT